MIKSYIFFTLLLITAFAYADNVYEYTDKNGMVVFTNKPIKNGKKVDLPPISVYASPITQNDYHAKGYTQKKNTNNQAVKVYVKNPTGSNFGTNETGRRQVLNEELQSEKTALSDSQTALTQAKTSKLPSEKNNPTLYQQRIQGLQDAVTEHQKNIEILSKQLGTN